MTKAEQIIETLRTHQRELEALGVRHAALFGSTARGTARAKSDIDLAISFAQTAEEGGLSYFGMRERVREYLDDLFDSEVDVSDPGMMRAHIRENYGVNRVDAF